MNKVSHFPALRKLPLEKVKRNPLRVFDRKRAFCGQKSPVTTDLITVTCYRCWRKIHKILGTPKEKLSPRICW